MNNGILTQFHQSVAMPYGLLGDPFPVPLIDKAYAYDLDAARYIWRVEAADGAPLELDVRVAINNFVLGCKTDGIWNAIKACCILAGARTLAGALVPLVGTAPDNVGPFVSDDYIRKTGLKGNGTTKYLDSKRNNNAEPQNNRHLTVFVSEFGSQDNDPLCQTGPGGTPGRTIIQRSTTSQNMTIAAASTTNSSGSNGYTGAGFQGVARQASASFLYRKSAATTSISNNSTTPFSGNYTFFFAPSGPTYGNSRIAFYSIGEFLNLAFLDARVTALINAFASAIP